MKRVVGYKRVLFDMLFCFTSATLCAIFSLNNNKVFTIVFCVLTLISIFVFLQNFFKFNDNSVIKK